jgi:hypothetical protein
MFQIGGFSLLPFFLGYVLSGISKPPPLILLDAAGVFLPEPC